MSEASADSARSYREARKSKARALGDGEDAVSVDSSSFTPGERLDTDAKTGMRPVSRQARKRGGAVHGEMSDLSPHALARPGRKPRREGGPTVTLGGRPQSLKRPTFTASQSASQSESDPSRLAKVYEDIDRRTGRRNKGGRSGKATGGGVGESYVNRNAKVANEARAGRKHDLGLKGGGRAARADGGRTDEAVYVPHKERRGASFTHDITKGPYSSAHETDIPTEIVKAAGGRVARQSGGPLAPAISNSGMLGSFNYRPGGAGVVGLRDGGRAKAHERYGAGPGPAEHHPGFASGGRAGRAAGGQVGHSDSASPSQSENKAADRPRMGPKISPRGENDGRARRLDPWDRKYESHAAGGKVAEGALRQHRAEHAAMKEGDHPKGCKCAKCAGGVAKAGGGGVTDEPPSYGQVRAKQARADQLATKQAFRAAGKSKATGGRAAHARGGKSGRGQMRVNIVIAPGGANPPSAQPPMGAGPPPIGPPGGAPVPMPPGPGAPPPAGPGVMPVPMPMPMPGAGAGPPMPPRAKGGRVAGIRKGDPRAGSGSGFGRLEKIREYGHRADDGAGLRK